MREVNELRLVNTDFTEPVNVIVRGYFPPPGRWARLKMAYAVWKGREIAPSINVVGNIFHSPSTITRDGITTR